MSDKYTKIAAQNAATFNKKYASVLYAGKHRILKKELNQDNQFRYNFLKQSDFLGIHQNQQIEVGKDTYMDAAKAWLKHPACATYLGGVYFKPVPFGEPDPFENDPPNARRFNLWQGFLVQPKKGTVKKQKLTELIYLHIFEVICSSDDDLFAYVIYWIAYTIQNPDKPAGVALIMRGDKGTGKGILGNFLLTLWGSHGVQIGSTSLTKKFNAQLSDASFVFADEVFVSGSKQDEATLKMLVTEPQMVIEPKGIDSYSQPNYLKILMATNENYAVPATKDERRYCVVDVADSKRGNADYFKKLLTACDDPDVQANFLNDMLTLDLTDFDIRVVPETKALRDQRMMTLNSVAQWLLDSLNTGMFFGEQQWYTTFSTHALYESYTNWANVHRVAKNERFSSVKMSEYLAKIGYKKKRIRDTEGHERRGYIFGDLDDAKELFKRFEKL